MTLPPLPENFGNPIFAGQVEIVGASGIDWMPQTPGWFVVGGLLIFPLARLAWRRGRRWYRNRYRREALTRLALIAQQNGAGRLTALNETLKLAAMAASSRGAVASLAGHDWTDWLNRRTPSPVFSANSIQTLGYTLYERAYNDLDSQLIDEARCWLQHHRDDHA